MMTTTLAVTTPDANDAIGAALVALSKSEALRFVLVVSVGPAGCAVVTTVFLGDGGESFLELMGNFTFAGCKFSSKRDLTSA